MTGRPEPAVAAPRATSRWPWIIAVASLAVYAAGNLLYPAGEANLGFTVMFGAILGAFVMVGAIITTRVPGNAVGPILLLSGGLLASTIFVGTVSLVWATSGVVAPEVVAITALLNDVGFVIPIIVVLIGIPLIFPDGRLLSPRWRWIVVLAVVAVLADATSQVFGPGPLGAAEVPNPFAVPALFPVLDVLDGFSAWSSIVGFGAAVAAVVIRFRRGDPVERQQLKWPAAVIAVTPTFAVSFLLPPGPVADVAFFIGLLALLCLPICIGIAVTRYRLYEIDRIISRTLSWGLVTAILVVVFAGLVIGLQTVLDQVTQGDTLAVAVSTLAAFALFQPVRRRVQHGVDRRFDRARYDGERTATAFADRLRDEVDLAAVGTNLTRSVEESLRPATVGLWLRERGA